ncbi:hypothetical protein D0U03_04215 [Bacillus velezensis]|nr:hypothetical protein D0U03_04215 [Bacillus velezensis]
MSRSGCSSPNRTSHKIIIACSVRFTGANDPASFYPRVTHPSAANIREQAPICPLDLHVLGTPPAFVLSQDQTLR